MTRDSLAAQPLADIAECLRSSPERVRELEASVIAARAAQPRHDPTPYREWRPDILADMQSNAEKLLRSGKAGRLAGLPVSVKDLYGVRGMETYAGTPKALPEKFSREGWLVSLLRQQGAAFTGKTHTVEFAFGGLGVNGHWGCVRNPWDPAVHRVSGGSSAGAGVSLTEGSALLALGTDTGGSVRIPAAMTGNVGLKTSIGRWSTDGVTPLSHTLDTVGFLARTVADAAFVFAAIEDTSLPQATGPAGLRIGCIRQMAFDDCSPGVTENVMAALRKLEAAGATVTEADFPEAETAFDLLCHSGIPAMELRRFIDAELPDWLQSMDWPVKRRMVGTDTSKVDFYQDRLQALARAVASADARFADFDVMVCPTVSVTPPAVTDCEEPETYAPYNLRSLRNTAIGNYLGLCGLTLPVGKDNAGIPVGLQLLAKGGNDRQLLSVGLAVEALLGQGADILGPAPGVIIPPR
ncbi:MAG: amidase [Rhodospirillales bacterium]